ncbi:MAG: DUF4097 family beta strand repeat protein [Blautia sp.]|nr:DUF4097 family beta strand repeat protein [Blautia sp.]
MGKSKKWIITGTVLLGSGLMICGTSFTIMGFDWEKLSTVKFVTNTYEIADPFANIRIDADTASLSFLPSEDGTCKVICHEEGDDPHKAEVQNDTLTIERKNNKSLRLFGIGFETESPGITVYLPEDTYKTCTIETDTGDITLQDLSAGDMQLGSDTGRIKLTNIELSDDLDIEENTGDIVLQNVTCRNLKAEGDTGDLRLTDVTASGEFRLETDTGDIVFDGCDADAIHAETDTGDVTGTLLSDKVFYADTDTGSVDVPASTTGGRCEIESDTGDIRLKIE